MTRRDWTEMDVSGQPRLLLGQRKSSKKIMVHRVELHQDLFDDLCSIAQGAVAELERGDAKPYSTFASKTGDDYSTWTYRTSTSPRPAPTGGRPRSLRDCFGLGHDHRLRCSSGQDGRGTARR
jgi:hypothetical protein